MTKQFDPSKPCQTRDGREARIYAVDGAGEYQIHGAIKLDGEWQSCAWRKDGVWHTAFESQKDLVNIPVVHERWVHILGIYGGIYTDKRTYKTKEEAEVHRIASTLAIVKLTFAEGEGL